MSLATARARPREPLADVELIGRVRDGDAEAFAELYRRHRDAALAAARSITSKIDPDDLVSESFAKILSAIRNGNGPRTAFRAYALTSVRNTAASWGASNKEDTVEDFEVEDPKFSDESLMAAIDRSLIVAAFRSLPQRWQEVLWYTEVEGMSPAETAPLLGLKAGAVPALSYRAREGLRQAWIQAHFESSPESSECRWAIGNLGANARQALRQRDRARMDAHLASCERCAIVAEEADQLAARLVLVLLPITIGTAAVAGYLAWGGGAAASAATVAAGGGTASALGAIGSGVKQIVARAGTAGAVAVVIVSGAAVVRGTGPAAHQPPAAAATAAQWTAATSDVPLSSASPSASAASEPSDSAVAQPVPAAPEPPSAQPAVPSDPGSAGATTGGQPAPAAPAAPPPPVVPVPPPPAVPPPPPPSTVTITLYLPGLAPLLRGGGLRVQLTIPGHPAPYAVTVGPRNTVRVTIPAGLPRGTTGTITATATLPIVGTQTLTLAGIPLA